MRTFRTLSPQHRTDLPTEFTGDDVRFPATFVEAFLDEFTEPGDAVVDPFAGFGTTLAVAEKLGRVPYGVEYDAERVAHVRERIDHPGNVIHGSALDVVTFDLPALDCCLTSPPYMVESDTRNPFQNYAGESTYDDYLADLREAFTGLAAFMAPDAHVLVEVSNLKHEGTVTTLAWDVANRLSEVFRFEGEIVVGWDDDDTSIGDDETYGYGYDHSYCLVFRAD